MADLETRCQEAFRDALEFAKLVQASDKWRTESEDNDFIVSHHPGIGADMEMVRTSMNINKPASEHCEGSCLEIVNPVYFLE